MDRESVHPALPDSDQRILALEAALAARDKTIQALILRARQGQQSASSAFGALRDGLALEEAVRRKTAELADAAQRIRQMENSLAAAQRLEAIGRLAAGVAHEINTPTQYVGDNLRFIATSAETLIALCEKTPSLIALCMRSPGSEEQARALKSEFDAADFEFLRSELPSAVSQSIEGLEHVAGIVRAMKEFSHPGAKNKAPVDINHALASTLTVGRAEWKYVAEVETAFAPDLPHVECLPGELNQVFLNILVNSAHAIADRQADDPALEGRIWISTRRVGDNVEIVFEDNGCGISEPNLKRVFEPFFTTKEVGRGTGQGLAMAYAVVVKQHGGAIDVSSELGAWTRLTLRLPVKSADAPQEALGALR